MSRKKVIETVEAEGSHTFGSDLNVAFKELNEVTAELKVITDKRDQLIDRARQALDVIQRKYEE